jgi:hypothetical protein
VERIFIGRAFPVLETTTLYCTLCGETLEEIAQKKLGDVTRWEEIRNLNPRLMDYRGNERLPPRKTLRLPAHS